MGEPRIHLIHIHNIVVCRAEVVEASVPTELIGIVAKRRRELIGR